MSTSSFEKNMGAVLLSWFESHGRDLPWRHTHDPYEIWVSEVILQQTQVSRGIEYYERFLKRFPSLDDLAKARWREMLPVWRGLGYYQRGHNMLKCAVEVRDGFHGVFPSDIALLNRLPGIGPYTARAIANFAFGIPVAPIDTNIQRVITRVYGDQSTQLQATADALMETCPKQSRLLGHALMDIGATLCKSTVIHCHQCPLENLCQFRKQFSGTGPFQLGIKKRESTKRMAQQIVGVACINHEGAYILHHGAFVEISSSSKGNLRSALKTQVKEALGIEISVRPPFASMIDESTSPQTVRYLCRCRVLRGMPPKTKDIARLNPKDFSYQSLPKTPKRTLEIMKILIERFATRPGTEGVHRAFPQRKDFI